MRPRQKGSRAIGPGTEGHVALEYAMTMPFLLAFMYGIMEISHFAYIKMTISEVAHDAVRYAIVHSSKSASPTTTSAVQTYASNELTALNLNESATITVTFSSGETPGGTVEVQISYPFTPFMPGFNTIPGTTETFTDLVGPISAVSEMNFNE